MRSRTLSTNLVEYTSTKSDISIPGSSSNTEQAERCHPVLAAAFAAVEERRIRWALLREPAGGLLEARGDIDIVVYGDDVPQLSAILRGMRFVRLPRSGSSAHFVRYTAETDEWLWIHVQSELGFGSAVPLTNAIVHDFDANTTTAGSIRTLSPEYAFWLLLWHCLAGKGRVASHHRPALSAGATKAEPDGAVARAFGTAIADADAPARIVAAVARRDWWTVDSHAEQIRRARTASRPPVAIRAIRKARRLASTARHWRQRQGLTVAVLGPDGAGKTSLIAAIRGTVPLPAVQIYMGLSGGGLRRTKRLRLPGLVFAASAAVIWSRYLRARYHAARGRLVICERYTYDAVAPHPDRLTAPQRVSRQLLGRLCPSPGLVLLLDAPGEVLHSRSGEYTAEMLEEWRQQFRTLETRLRNCEVLDATAPASDVSRAAITHIWSHQAALWRAGDRSGGDDDERHSRGSRNDRGAPHHESVS